MKMKRKLLVFGAAVLLLTSCTTAKRYGCRGKGRCIVVTQAEPTHTRDA